VLSSIAWYRATKVIIDTGGSNGRWDGKDGRSVVVADNASDAKLESDPTQQQRFRKHDRSSTETWKSESSQGTPERPPSPTPTVQVARVCPSPL
jgi:hypothetical protein